MSRQGRTPRNGYSIPMEQIPGELTTSPMVSPRSILFKADIIENFFFVGADDVIAFKPNSTMITIRNVTSHGSTGLSFGSIGQYPGVVRTIDDAV
jgi:hypothetical protein